MTLHEYQAKLEVLRQITNALSLPESPERAKVIAALWELHAITPLSGGGPGEER